MNNPLVVCVMLTTGKRVDMIQRATRCWARQTYRHAELFIHRNDGTRPICHLMNEANAAALEQFPRAKYLVKWDDDDMSDARRIREQLNRLRNADKLVTGYFDMPMLHADTGEVTMYSNPAPTYALGTSLFFHRDAWERKRFPDTTRRTARGTGSDTLWVTHWAGEGQMLGVSCFGEDMAPRMIASLHGDNTAPAMRRGGFGKCCPAVADEVRKIAAGL